VNASKHSINRAAGAKESAMVAYSRKQIDGAMAKFEKLHGKNEVAKLRSRVDMTDHGAVGEILLGDFGIDPAAEVEASADNILPGSGTPIDPVAIMKSYNDRGKAAMAKANRPK
jgi:hypothetical protein